MTGRFSRWSGNGRATTWIGEHLAVCHIPLREEEPHTGMGLYLSQDGTIIVVAEGRIYNGAEIARLLGQRGGLSASGVGDALGQLYQKDPEHFLDRVNGQFAFALWDGRDRRLLLGRDRLGIESLYYCDEGGRVVFGSSLKGLLATGWVTRDLNHEAVLQYLLYCYNPGQETFFRNVFKVPAGHLLSIAGARVTKKRYWRLSFGDTRVKGQAEYREEILNLIEDAIRIRLEPDRSAGILLSGGTDSSTIVSMASRISPMPLRTFSFRCEGRSYDESSYARLVADRYGTEHTEVSYGPGAIPLISRVVESMDEPFCDIGIEIGTYLLGQSAQGKVSTVLSGEGGDELFGGHPVYVADRVAAVVDRMPRTVVGPLARFLQRIPDSDHKKNLQVKLKRFAYGLTFPPELSSHRWRIYYTPAELEGVCSRDFLVGCEMGALFGTMLEHAREADGADALSRSLHSDYFTLVDFYLRRLGLLRAYSLHSQVPLLDHRLVEYAATIPSKLKIRNMSQTKYLYRKILEGVLPVEILHQRPKLGHSVPMKNWLREDAGLREWTRDALSGGSLEKSGIVRAAAVRRMIDEHHQKRHNHSHRLWGLVVLEAWLTDLRGGSTPAMGHHEPAARSDHREQTMIRASRGATEDVGRHPQDTGAKEAR